MQVLHRGGTFFGAKAVSVDVGAVSRYQSPITDERRFVQAAAVPQVSIASFQCLEKVVCEAGARLLITGGAGGVGTTAIQMAKNVFKVSTITTSASVDKMAVVKRLGAGTTYRDDLPKPLTTHTRRYCISGLR